MKNWNKSKELHLIELDEAERMVRQAKKEGTATPSKIVEAERRLSTARKEANNL